MIASVNGHVDVVDVLVQGGAIVDMQEKVGLMCSYHIQLQEWLFLSNPKPL